MSFDSWKPYVTVAERQQKSAKAIAKAKKAGADMTPIAAYRGAIAKTFWGKAWCDNLERYSDYANRMPRGRTYVRNGSVIDLKITAGEVRAQVMGSSLYKVEVTVKAVPLKKWHDIGEDCAGSIDTLVELLQGKLSKAVMERICKKDTGLFPSPKEIKFSCSCPDFASMCKHIAAVLYGVGARLDQQPELIFSLRRVDAKDLVAQTGAGLQSSVKRPKAGKLLDNAALADVFGIEMAESPTPRQPIAARKKPSAAKVAAKKTLVLAPVIVKVKAVKKVPVKKVPAKKVPAKKVVAKKTPVKKVPEKLSAASAKPASSKVAVKKTKTVPLPAPLKNKDVTTKRASAQAVKKKVVKKI